MRQKKYMGLVKKSRSACVSALETYNRASTMYREESFAILMINAWELLLKARIMKECGGSVSSLYEYRSKKKKDGTPSKIKEVKTTRSGSPMTIGLDKACNIVSGYGTDRVDKACAANIEALMEVRDSATHFVVPDAILRKALAEISLAAVRNYVLAAQSWFGVSFSDLNVASIPLSFDLDQNDVEAVAKKSSEAALRFLAHMQSIEAASVNENSEFSFKVRVNFDLIKKKQDNTLTASIVAVDPDITVTVEGDVVPAGFTWSYQDLTNRLAGRYVDFKINKKFHKILKPFRSNGKFCYERFLNPANKFGSKKAFYSPNILREFDAHYVLRGASLFETISD